MNRKHAFGRNIAAVAVLGLGFAHNAANADPMQVQAIVQGVCELGTLGPVDFGTLTPGGGDVSTSSTIQWRCSNGTTGDITIDDGSNGVRRMSDPGTATLISYELFQDAGLANRWGGAGEEVTTPAGSGMAAAFQTVDVYGEVLDADYISAEPGTGYVDTVQVTITAN